MDKKKSITAGLVIGAAFLAGMELERAYSMPDAHQRLLQGSTVGPQFLIGRQDHDPEQWPNAVRTYRGVQTLVTTPAANRFVLFDTLREKSSFSDYLVKPITYTDWVR